MEPGLWVGLLSLPDHFNPLPDHFNPLPDMVTKKNWLEKTFKEVEINGQKLKFYEIKVNSLIDIKDLVINVVQAYMTMSRDIKQDAGSSDELESHPNGTYSSQRIRMTAPIDLVQHHDTQRSMAVHQFVAALSDHMEQLAELILESLRISDMTPAEFMEQAGASTFGKCVIAMLQANGEVFAPFMKAALTPEQVTDGSEDPASEEIQSLRSKSGGTPKKPGATSPTPSPSSFVPDIHTPS